VATYGNGTHNLLGIGGTQTATLNTGTTSAIFNLIGALTTFDISSAAGATVTVNNNVAVANELNLTTNGGNLTLASSAGVLGATSVVIDGGSFTVGSSILTADVLTGAKLSFAAPGGTVVVGSGSLVTIDLLTAFAPITDYNSTADVIDDKSLSFADVTSYTISGTLADHIITVNASNGTTFSFAVGGSTFTDGSYTTTSGPLHLVADASGGTELAACFLGGTLIMTPNGEAPVENLKIGDPVLAADGRTFPVRWIGRNTVMTRNADPVRLMPIRIRAGALRDGVPKRDLLLSPEHALLIDGLLVQASALVNGISITREAWMPETFVYYHVEVEDHALIIAEGTAAETFVDHIARKVFDNWREHQDLYGFDASIPEMDYPRVLSARQLPDAIERRLLDRSLSPRVDSDDMTVDITDVLARQPALYDAQRPPNVSG
jgi:hypothetical protein